MAINCGVLCLIALAGFVAVLANAASTTSQYCKLETCPELSHTLCRSPGGTIRKRCGHVRSSGLTEAEVQDVLNAHNKYRANVASGQEKRGRPGPQPAAANLGPLKWDQELADIAQALANECTERKDLCRNTEKFPYVGQSIAWDLAYESVQEELKTVSELVADWYSQVESFNSTEVQSYKFSKRTEGYTQLMWAETTHVGCGVMRNKQPFADYVDMALVCNYGPGGNIVGQKIYETV